MKKGTKLGNARKIILAQGVVIMLLVVLLTLALTNNCTCDNNSSHVQLGVSDTTDTPEEEIEQSPLQLEILPPIEEEEEEEEEESIEEEVIEESDTFPQFIENIPLDEDLKEYIYIEAMSAGIPAEIMFALANIESSYNITAQSGTNDHGLFQINEINFEWMEEVFNISDIHSEIYNPYVNTDCSIYIISNIIANYDYITDWHSVLMAYNFGPTGAREVISNSSLSSEYSKKVIDLAIEFGLEDIQV